MNLLKTQAPRPWVIYTLSDPRTPDIVRYVGATHKTKISAAHTARHEKIRQEKSGISHG